MMRKRIISVCLLFAIVLGICVGCGLQTGEAASEGYTDTEAGNSETEEKSPEQLEPVKDATRAEITDMSKAFGILMEKGTKRFFRGYPVEENFLQWINKTFGEAVVMNLAYRLYEGYDNPALWYSQTGNSIHVLWLEYCKALQCYTYYLKDVCWLQTEEEQSQREPVTLMFTGDINLADDWYTMQEASQWPNGVADCIAPEITTLLQGADLSVVNHEFVISEKGSPLEGKSYTFRSKPENIKYLELFGTDVANMANNHAFDFGAEALLDSIELLEKEEILTIGAGADIKEAGRIRYFIANGKKIAMVSATQIERYSNFTQEATETLPGVLKTRFPAKFCSIIEEASKNSDYVIANVHWGSEGTYYYGEDQKQLAEKFVEAGADIIIGGHPHRLQGVEYLEGVPVLYSLGNFWFSTGTLYTTIAQIQITEDGQFQVGMIPCIQKDLKVSLLEGEDADRFYKFMADISADVAIDSEGYFYPVTEDGNLPSETLYFSGNNYAYYYNNKDLEGRPIDIVGNLK